MTDGASPFCMMGPGVPDHDLTDIMMVMRIFFPGPDKGEKRIGFFKPKPSATIFMRYLFQSKMWWSL